MVQLWGQRCSVLAMNRADNPRLTPMSQAYWRLLPQILSHLKSTRRRFSKKTSVRQMNANIPHVTLHLPYHAFAYADGLIACDNYACKDIKDSASGSNLVIQRYLAYNAFVNLNNFFEVMISQLLTASNNGLGISTTISTVGECDPE